MRQKRRRLDAVASMDEYASDKYVSGADPSSGYIDILSFIKGVGSYAPAIAAIGSSY